MRVSLHVLFKRKHLIAYDQVFATSPFLSQQKGTGSWDNKQNRVHRENWKFIHLPACTLQALGNRCPEPVPVSLLLSCSPWLFVKNGKVSHVFLGIE